MRCPALAAVVLPLAGLLAAPWAHAETFPRLDCLIEPFQVIDVGSTQGIIRSVEVDRSQAVEAGDLLVQLDDSEQQATVRQAKARAAMTGELEASEAALAFAQRKYDRIASMKDNNAISALQRDEVRTELELAHKQLKQAREARDLARLDLARARTELANRTVKSPVSGIVIERFVSPGEYVNDTPLLRLAQMNPLRVETLAPSDLFGRVHAGMQALIATDSETDSSLVATVTIVDRLIDPASGTFGIRLELDNPDYAIPSGLNCQLTLQPIVAESEPAPASEPVARAAPPAARPQAVAERADDDASVCVALGPISDTVRRDALLSSLRERKLEAAARSDGEEQVIGYFVATPPTEHIAESRDVAQRIREVGELDVAILTKRAEGFRVSLGLFSTAKAAEQRFTRLGALAEDVGAEVITRTRSEERYWVELQANAETIEQQPWQSVAPDLQVGRCTAEGLMADSLSLEP